jgi:hypothetical protein
MRVRPELRRLAVALASMSAVAGMVAIPTAAADAASDCSSSTSLPWRSPPEPYGEPHHYFSWRTRVYVMPCGFHHHFYNYDNGAGHTDNPVTIIFVSNSPNLVGRVYDAVEDEGLVNSGDPMELKGFGYPTPHTGTQAWTSDSHGRKDDPSGCRGQCKPAIDIHIRTYGADGPTGTQVYQSTGTYRYYMLATTHFDISEGTSSAHFGYNDHARAILVGHMQSIGKWTVVGKTYVSNKCYGWLDSRHFCDSDGWAVIVKI